MLSHLDCIIFPDRCEVIEIIPSQRYVYPIFKNASSSLFAHAYQNKCKIKLNDQIKKIHTIEIFLRNPQQRFISGLNTFVQHIIRDNPGLDQKTVIWFAKNYLFLNRHYCPQFFWLINLSRYLSADAQLFFQDMTQVSTITQLHELPTAVEPINTDMIDQLLPIPDIQMYQRIDQSLIDHALNKTMTFRELLHTIRRVDPMAYDWTVGRSQRILDPTYVLPKT